MVRNVVGSLIALIGAAAAVWSPFRAWYDGRLGRDVRIEDLFNGLTRSSAQLLGSIFLPMLFAALVALIGILLRSRALVSVAGLVVLACTVLWMIRQGQAAGSLTAGDNGLGIGVAAAVGGGILLLLGALLMSGRGRRTHGRRTAARRGPDDDPDAETRYGRGGGGAGPYETPYDHDRPPPAYPGQAGDDGGRPPGASPATPRDPGRTAGQAPGAGPSAPRTAAHQQHPTPPVQWGHDLRQSERDTGQGQDQGGRARDEAADPEATQPHPAPAPRPQESEPGMEETRQYPAPRDPHPPRGEDGPGT